MQKQLTFKGKFDLKGNGTFTGAASVAGNIDQGGDRVMRGAFRKDLEERGASRPLLWQHDHGTPIGKVELAEEPKGLRVTSGRLLLAVQKGAEAYELLRAGIIDGMSIGYEVPAGGWVVKGGVRELHEIRLYEVSLVTFPMNVLARVDAVKGDEARLGALLAGLRSTRIAIESEREAEELRGALAGLRAVTKFNTTLDELLRQL